MISMADQVIKIFCPAPPFVKQFNKKQFKTIAQFQTQLEQWFGIRLKHQVLIKDSMRLDLPNSNPFDLLNLNAHTRFMVVAQPQTAQKREQHEKEQLINEKILMIKESRIKRIESNKKKQIQAYTRSKFIYLLESQTIRKIIDLFVKRLNLPKSELLILNENKLKFIINKLTYSNPTLRQILLRRIPTVKKALISQQLQKRSLEMKSTIEKDQLNQLIGLGYNRQDVQVALQISKNQINGAIDILYHRKLKTYAKVRVKGSNVEEYLCIHSWLQRQDNRQIIMLYHVPNYRDVYLNSLKHTCPTMFKLMLKWHSYLNNLIQFIYSQIKLPSIQ